MDRRSIDLWFGAFVIAGFFALAILALDLVLTAFMLRTWN